MWHWVWVPGGGGAPSGGASSTNETRPPNGQCSQALPSQGPRPTPSLDWNPFSPRFSGEGDLRRLRPWMFSEPNSIFRGAAWKGHGQPPRLTCPSSPGPMSPLAHGRPKPGSLGKRSQRLVRGGCVPQSSRPPGALWPPPACRTGSRKKRHNSHNSVQEPRQVEVNTCLPARQSLTLCPFALSLLLFI